MWVFIETVTYDNHQGRANQYVLHKACSRGNKIQHLASPHAIFASQPIFSCYIGCIAFVANFVSAIFAI